MANFTLYRMFLITGGGWNQVTMFSHPYKRIVMTQVSRILELEGGFISPWIAIKQCFKIVQLNAVAVTQEAIYTEFCMEGSSPYLCFFFNGKAFSSTANPIIC